ncbi:hypothetical protein PTKIN_Ptkin10aG0066300 [Pterospermum kingtungense]
MWVKDGDKNTRYFHNLAFHRKHFNKIHVILDEHGVEEKTQEGIVGIFLKYFINLFSSSNPEDFEFVLDLMRSRITDAECVMLSEQFTKDEVISVVKSMAPDRASGPDGLKVEFF